MSRQTFNKCMQWEPGLPGDLVEEIWRDPHALLSAGDTLQDKPRTKVVRLDHEAGVFVWKHHNWGSVYRTLKKSLARSTARKAWRDGHFLLAGGIPTPRPRAIIEQRFGPLRGCSYVLTDYVPGTSLYRLMRFERPSRDVVRDLARQVAAIWQRLDELCVWHNDFKTENLLVDPQGKVWLIDLERTRRFRSRERLRRRQVRDANDLLHPRNWRSEPGAAEVFRREILQTPAATAALAASKDDCHPLIRPIAAANCPSQLVTVLIPCFNAAATIVACIDSVRDMADEILVADAGSTDETLRLVRQRGGCRIIEQANSDGVAFESWAHAHARHPWILRILPNEELNSELGRQVQDTLACKPSEHGFRISRAMCFHGQRLNYGGFHDDSSVRLYRKDAARYVMRGGRVEAIVAEDKVGSLRSRLVYESCLNIQQLVHEMTELAGDMAIEHKQLGLAPKRLAVLWRTPWEFVRSYVFRSGWLDGWAGLHASSLAAFSIYLRESLLWEMHQPGMGSRALHLGESPKLKIFDPLAVELGHTLHANVRPFADAKIELPDEFAGERKRLRPAA